MAITLTDAAIEKVKLFLESRGKGIGLRLGLNTAVCAGMAYILEFADERKPGDYLFDQKGVKILVDPKSFFYLDGTVLDYITDGENERFKFNNPNEGASCECGDSFYVD